MTNEDYIQVSPHDWIQCKANGSYNLCSATLPKGRWLIIGHGILKGDVYLTNCHNIAGRNYLTTADTSIRAIGFKVSSGNEIIDLTFNCTSDCMMAPDGNYCGIFAIRLT